MIDRLIATGEIFFEWKAKPCHQICLYYKVRLRDESQLPNKDIFHGYDDFDNERINLDFCWVELERLKHGLRVYPLELVPIILSGKDEAVHFVSRIIK